jgi:hypothetical protein
VVVIMKKLTAIAVAMFIASTAACAVEPADGLSDELRDTGVEADVDVQLGCAVDLSCRSFNVDHNGVVTDPGALRCALQQLANGGPLALGVGADGVEVWTWDWELYADGSGEVQVLRSGELLDEDHEPYPVSRVESCVLRSRAFFEACLVTLDNDSRAACGKPTSWYGDCEEVATLSCAATNVRGGTTSLGRFS